MAESIGSFGSLAFVCSMKRVRTFSELSRELSVRWAKHDLIGRKPDLEWVGEDLNSVSIQMR
ncbi:MAG: phage tail protein, partial [Firmicutes bacterium]|nr:phage tail protein [Bacillota bacterium]